MVKVTVVVPTYCSGEGLDRVVASLDAQTMPTDEFEVVFVDDGSPDDTYDRLLDVASTRPHVRVERIEGSGWASRPRNVGQDLARGEYVLFMDHDDELYPDGLERAHAFGAPHGADVINPKEVRTKGWNWGMDVWREDRVLSGDDLHVRWIYPMTPHKLYRTEFLREHGIRFREGARVLWEDIYFNTEVYARLGVLALYGSTPVYRWVIGTGANNSATFAQEPREWWDNIESVVDFAASGIVDGDDQRFLVQHQYTGRVLAMFASDLDKRAPGFREESVRRAPALVARSIPPEVDRHLAPTLRARSALLRSGDLDALERLSRADARIRPRSRLREARWESRELVLATTTSWELDGRALPFRVEGDRVLRELPDLGDDAAARVPDDVLDVTEAVGIASARLSGKDRETRAGWIVPTTCDPRVEEVDGVATVVVDSVTRVAVDGSAAAPSLLSGTWELSVRTSFMGLGGQHALTDELAPMVALLEGDVAVLYTSKHGILTVDSQERVRRVVGAARTDVAAARLERTHEGELLTVPFEHVHVDGLTDLPCEVVLRNPDLPARTPGRWRERVASSRVVADRQGARIEAILGRALPGTWQVLVRRGGRTRDSGVRLRAGRTGRLSLVR